MAPHAFLAAGAVALGFALQIANGHYQPVALALLTCAFALCAKGVFSLGSSAEAAGTARHTLRVILAAGIAAQAVALFIATPGVYLDVPARLALFRTGVVLEAALIWAGATGVRRCGRLWFPALLVVHLALGVWMIRASPSPHIDVVTVHREAIAALMHGHDPYQVTFENIYAADLSRYNPQDVVGGRVQFGYPYPPLSLLLAVPGQMAAGDYRYAELAALIIGAGAIGYASPGVISKLAATLLLTTPRGFFVLEQGWTEPIVVLFLGMSVFLLVRKSSRAAYAVGLLLVTKQYLLLAGAPLLRLVLQERKWRRFIGTAAAVAVIVTLPLALWHPRAFIGSVVLLQLREPFRSDSLSYLSWVSSMGLGAGSFVWSIAAAGIALSAGMIRTPNTPAGFAATLALSSFAAFMFGSKAFCNYYFVVIAAICCAIAAQPVVSRD
jgi:hypothetical protein